jgi:polar amino acid transport system substrate-binding protein
MSFARLIFSGLIFLMPVTGLAEPLEKVSLYLNWKHQFEYAGFYMAKERGYYKEAGLDVDIIEYDGTHDLIETVHTTPGAYGLFHAGVIQAYLNGKPVRLLANFFKRSPLVLVTRPEISTPQGLRGKKILSVAHDLDSINIHQLLHDSGLGPGSFEHVPSQFSMEPFINGAVDASAIFLTNELFELDRKGIDYNILDPNNYGQDIYDGNLFAGQREVALNPERAHKLREASIRGWIDALDNPSDAIDLILEKYNSQNKTREQLEFEAEQIRKIMLPDSYPIGYVEQEKVQNIAGLYRDLGLVNGQRDIDGLFAQLNSNALLDAEEWQALHRYQGIRFCIDPDWYPLESLDEQQQVQGITADIIPLLEKQLSIALELVPTETWAETLELVQTGQCDLIPMISMTPERETYLSFSKPYLTLPAVIVTTDEQIYIDGIEQLRGKRMGVVSGYAYKALIEDRYQGVNIVDVKNGRDGIRKVQSGDIDAFIDYAASVVHVIQTEGIVGVKISGEADLPLSIRMAVPKEQQALVPLLNRALDAIGEVAIRDIYNKYISVTYTQGFDYRLFWQFVVVVVLIGAFMAFRYAQLSRFNREIQKARDQLAEAHQELQQKNARLESLATTDALTGLNNRLRLDQLIEQEQNRFDRYDNPYSVILFDIDDFKKVNDDYGHEQGDIVLRKIAEIVSQGIRKTDFAGRWGGEEFLIVCPATAREGALYVAETLRQKIEELQLDRVGHITSSFGVAMIQEGEKFRNLFSRVDQALYRAKEKGKNQVITG